MIDDELERAALTHLLIAAAMICPKTQDRAVSAIPADPEGRAALAASVADGGRAIAALGDAAVAIVRFGSAARLD